MHPGLDIEKARFNMVEQQVRTWDVLDQSVLDLLFIVKREEFVPPAYRALAFAYMEIPLRIGDWDSGEFMWAPKMEARILQELAIRSNERVLEIGTGSGYQAAVLAELGANVYTIEIVEPLGREAAKRLSELGYTTIVTRIGDGYRGWPEHAPFDAIIVTAAAPDVPAALQEQLKTGGRLVIPIGSPLGAQTLYVAQKDADGRLARRQVLAVRFVPMTGVR
jgi:protein-L-isoaspartate(D-aspartate) O-methyltransferase